MRSIFFSIPMFLVAYSAMAQDLDIGIADIPLEGEIIVLDGEPGSLGGIVSEATFSFVPSVDFAGPGAGTGDGGDHELMSLLRNQSIRDEIELVADQYEKMRKRNELIQAELREVSESILKGGKNGGLSINSEAISKIKERTAELQKRAKADLEDMLLPHQIKRLKQVALHNRMNQLGTAEALSTGTLADALELTDEQKELLKEKSKEIEERVRTEIAKIRSDAKSELFKILDSKQQAKLKELVGDHFEKESPKRSRIHEMMKRRFSKEQDGQRRGSEGK